MRRALYLLVVLSAGLAACRSYRPMPLDAQAVKGALAVPPQACLREWAKSISHPILRPVEVDLSDGLSPDEGAVLAVLVNPGLRAARDERALSAAQLLQAGLLPDPQLAAGVELPTGGGSNPTGYNVGLSWAASALIGHAAREQAAAEHEASVDLSVAWQEWQVAEAAKGAVYGLAALEEQVASAEDALKQAQGALSAVEGAIDAGEMTRKELAAARAMRDAARDELLRLRKQAEQQRLKLYRLLGLPAESDLKLQKGLTLPSRVEAPAAAELLRGLEQRRLDLVALRRGYASQEAAVRAAVLSQFPGVSLGLSRARDTEGVRTLGFQVSIGLPVFDRARGRIAIQEATRQRLFDEYADRLFQARADVAALLAGIGGLDEQIAAAERSAESLRMAAEIYRTAMEAGESDALTYAVARKDWAQKRTQVVELKGQLAQARVALELASGLYEIPAGASAGEGRGR